VISDFTFITSAEKTDVGLKRKNNEDSIISLPQFGVYCVADGMGGVQDGEVASQAVVDTLEECYVTGSDSASAITARASANIVIMAFNKASKWVEDRSHEKGLKGCGSTAVAIVFDKVMPDRAMVLHAGDSRAYRLRNKKLQQLNTDHSVAAEAGIADENDLPPMLRGVITRAVGLNAVVDVEETPVEVKADDIYLLCSDGLSRMLNDKKICSLIKKNQKKSNSEVVDILIDSALKAGGKDNVSVILMRVSSDLPEGPLMAIPEDTLRLESMDLAAVVEPGGDAALSHDDDESYTGDTVTGQTHFDDGVAECSTPASESDEMDIMTPHETPAKGALSPEINVSGGTSKVLILISGVLLVLIIAAAVAAALYFKKN